MRHVILAAFLFLSANVSLASMSSMPENSTVSAYPSPAGRDVIGSIAHACVGLGSLTWGTRCLMSFEPNTRAERFGYLWSGFWEAFGPFFLLAVPDLCYNSIHCYQRNVTHMLASASIWFGVGWDIVAQRMALEPNIGIAIFSSILPAYFLYFHDHDTMEMDDDSEFVIHQNAMMMFGTMGVLRLALPQYRFLHQYYALASISLGFLMTAAGPILREWLVGKGLSGTNISFMAYALAGGHSLTALTLMRNRRVPAGGSFSQIPLTEIGAQ
jgi:hypothetical protein